MQRTTFLSCQEVTENKDSGRSAGVTEHNVGRGGSQTLEEVKERVQERQQQSENCQLGGKRETECRGKKC